jgi:hypothetical protein
MEVFAFTNTKCLPNPKPNEIIWYCGRVNDTKHGFWCTVVNGGWRLTYSIADKRVSHHGKTLSHGTVLIFRRECPPKHILDYNEAIWWGIRQYEKDMKECPAPAEPDDVR